MKKEHGHRMNGYEPMNVFDTKFMSLSKQGQKNLAWHVPVDNCEYQ